MKTISLWLDDLRQPPEGWVWVKTYSEAVETVTRPDVVVDEMSLDHDLGDKSLAEGGTGDGYDFICFVEQGIHDYKIDVPHRIVCHSANGPGRDNINRAIASIYSWIEEGY